MRSEQVTMRSWKYSMAAGIALVCVILFGACNNVIDPPVINTPVESGYGRISINLIEEKNASSYVASPIAKTVLPSLDFDTYEYTFTKEGEAEGMVKTPDNGGFFTLEVGSYTVSVQAYMEEDEESYTLIASGVSQQFSVSPGVTTPVEVTLTRLPGGDQQGIFSYTVTYPAGAGLGISLQKWPGLENIPLNPANVSQGNGKTETLQLEAGSYMLTIFVNKSGLYAGIGEAIHITPLLTTVYTKNYLESDLLPKFPGATVGGPVFSSATADSITIEAVDPPSNGQDVEYGISKTDNVNDATWRSNPDFSDLDPGTNYYICTRSAENEDYAPGAASPRLHVVLVTNNTHWSSALTFIGNIGSGTAGNLKTYTIAVVGNVAINGSSSPSLGYGLQYVAVTLKGSGTLSLNSNGSIFNLYTNQTLIIDDENLILQGRSGNNSSVLYAGTSGALELKNGTISGNTGSGDYNGGGVYVGGGSFTMTGGTISDNTASGGTNGGGVYVGGGSFTMAGGTISGNTAYRGGGVYVITPGSFTMAGGTIHGSNAGSPLANIASDNGAALYVASGTAKYGDETNILPHTEGNSLYTNYSITPGSNGGAPNVEYDITGTGTFFYDGTARTVIITPKEGTSPGAITVWYEGISPTDYVKSETAPADVGTYNVTFDVAEELPFPALTGLPAGTITINNRTPVAGDYIFTGLGPHTYDGTAKAVTVTAKTDGSLVSPGAVSNIRYNSSATPPTNAGTYEVTFDVAAAPGWDAATGLVAGNIIISKAPGGTVSAPTMASKTYNSITLNAVSTPSTGQAVEYARNTTSTAPTSGWQASTTFGSLTASTTHYFFARSVENTNYSAGAASAASSPITTRHTYTVTANGSNVAPKSKTNTLTFTFSGNPGTVTASDITLSGGASIGSATVSGSGNTRTLSPITVIGAGSATVSITHADIETGSQIVQVYDPLIAGLYAKAPPISSSDTPVNLSGVSGATIVEQAITRINSNPGTYTLMLDSDINVAGHSTTDASNNNATRHLKTTNAKLTILGIDEERKISVTYATGAVIFTVGNPGQTDIELTLGSNITLVGYWNAGVYVQDGAAFTMLDSAKVSNYGVYGGNITMSGSASITGGISGSDGYITMSGNSSVTEGMVGSNRTITMSGNASVTGNVDIGSNSTFTMQNYSSVTNGGVYVGANSKFYMNNNAKVSGNNGDGVTVSGSGSVFTMSGNSSVSNNNRGVYVSYGSFTMQDYALVSNNNYSSNGGGVHVSYDSTFTMQGYASVFGNSGNNGGGVYVASFSSSNQSTFTMQGNASVSGNTATSTGGGNGGGGVYVGTYGTFDMKGGVVSGNTATNSNGGGVYVNDTFTMTGGTIYGGTASTLSNTASTGSALYVAGSSIGTTTCGSTTYPPGSVVDNNLSLGGAVSATVSYNTNGATSGSAPGPQAVSVGTSITLAGSSTFSRTGYTFGGWNTNASGTGTNYNGSSPYTVIGNITLYARWDIVLAANAWSNVNIPSGGEEWVRFTATAATQYIHVSFGTLTDLWVQVYESNRTTVVEGQTNLYNTYTSTSRTTLTSGQVYYIKVWPYSSSYSGTFRIAFNTSATPPP